MEKISIDKAIATSAAPSAMEGYCMIAFCGLAERFFHLHTLFIVTVIQALLGFNSVCRFLFPYHRHELTVYLFAETVSVPVIAVLKQSQKGTKYTVH